jgi:two-component sensor histidine kinase
MSRAMPWPTDAPLPTELVGSGHGWWSGYRRYAVFSAGWVTGRMRSWGVGLAVWTLVALGLVLNNADVDARTAAIVVTHTLMSYGLPMLLGPLAGAWVVRQPWPTRRTGIALALAMAAVVGACVAVQVWLLDPVKDQVAQWTGDVDAQGRRNRVQMVLGVTTFRSSEQAPQGQRAVPSEQPVETVADSVAMLVTAVVLTFWLAGGLGLWHWHRQQAMLLALQQRRRFEAERAARQEAEIRLSVLAAQVEPHFLFNTLAGVRSAMTSDPARASEMIDRLVDYLRASIPQLRADGHLAHSTLEAQIDVVRAYLALMHARVPRLRQAIDVPARLHTARFPPLMLISLAENAVKHGVEPKIGPASITVSAREDSGFLEVAVADDGVGFSGAEAGSGIGLANVRARLQELYGDRAELALRTNAGGGMIATIRLPLEAAA